MTNTAHNWLYALACVFLPVLWGLVMVWATSLIERFFAREKSAEIKKVEPKRTPEIAMLSPEYHI